MWDSAEYWALQGRLLDLKCFQDHLCEVGISSRLSPPAFHWLISFHTRLPSWVYLKALTNLRFSISDCHFFPPPNPFKTADLAVWLGWVKLGCFVWFAVMPSSVFESADLKPRVLWPNDLLNVWPAVRANLYILVLQTNSLCVCVSMSVYIQSSVFEHLNLYISLIQAHPIEDFNASVCFFLVEKWCFVAKTTTTREVTSA